MIPCPVAFTRRVVLGGAFVVLLGLAAVACKNARQAEPVAPAGADAASVVVPAEGRSVTFRVELARTRAEVAKGLMYRQQLAPDAGMLFLFDRADVLSFWMKNTFIPLDLIFMDAGRKIVGIVPNAQPQSLAPLVAPSPAQFVLEINGGLAARLGIRPGAVVEFHGVDR
jgi:uncharacterized membrane protein (UPF0127 family)